MNRQRWKYMNNKECKQKGYLNPSFVDFYFRSILAERGGGVVRLDFGRRMKLAGETPCNRGTAQLSALIPTLISSRVLVLSCMMEKSPTLLKIAFFVTRHLSDLWRSVRPSFYIA